MTARRSGPGDASRAGAFFDRFRTAVGRLPAGLIRTGPPATVEHLAAAEAALGRRLPDEYASFLRSFDGADLFHESVIVAGVGPGAPLDLVGLRQDYPGELVFAEAPGGEGYTLDGRGRVLRRDLGADERALSGSSFERWLDSTVAREEVLFGPDGEYLPDLYDATSSELLPQVALRQAERALRADPGAADAEHARGLALVRLDHLVAALEAFGRAAELDPESPWPAFDSGRTALSLGRAGEARSAFRRAAEREPGPNGARLLAWAARAAQAAGDSQSAAALRAEALARDPGLVDQLRRAARAAADDDDPGSAAEATGLLEVIEPGASGLLAVRRLPVLPSGGPEGKNRAQGPTPGRRISGREPPPPRPAPRRRPRREAPPRPGGPRRGPPR